MRIGCAAVFAVQFSTPLSLVPVAAQPNVTNGVITNDDTAELRGQGRRSSRLTGDCRVRPAVRAALRLAPLALRCLMFCARALVGSEGKKPLVVN